MEDTMTMALRGMCGERGAGPESRLASGRTGSALQTAPRTRSRAGVGWALAAAMLGLTGALGAEDLGSAGGAADESEVRPDRPNATPSREAPRVRLDLGVGAGQHGFRLSVTGGSPGGRALLVLRPEDGAPAAQVVELDEHGAGAVTRRGWPGTRDLDAWFLVGNKGGGGGTSTNQVTVPAGGASSSAPVQRGEVLITEFLKDPKSVSDTSGEWVELWNATQRKVNLEGAWLLDDGGDQHMLYNKAQGIWLQPGQHFVLARKGDPAVNGGVAVDYVYTGFSLSNGADEIRLVSRGGVLIDEVLYDDGIFWPDEAGKSISLDPRMRASHLNDDPANWCHGQSPISAGNPDLGSPGAKNPRCL